MARARGYIDDWKPHAGTRVLVEAVQKILAEYVPNYGPMTLRQIFYRLVASVALPKTIAAYKTLSDHLSNARRARVISFDDIRDDGDVKEEPNGWQSAAEFIHLIQGMAKRFTTRRDIGQPYRTIIAIEATGMVAQVARTADPYGVTVRSAGGFDGVTGKHALALDILRVYREEGRPTRLLHAGDYDKSGEDIHTALFEDIAAFIGPLASVAFLPERIALTEAQVIEFGLPVQPAKKTGKKFKGVGDDPNGTVQLEALKPDKLAEIIEDAILTHWDAAALEALEAREQEERDRLLKWIKRAG